MSRGVSRFKGERLTRARESRGITKASLAAMIGISAAAISQYEKEQRSPSSDILTKIATCLNFPMYHFLHEVAQRPSDPIFFRSMSSATKIARLSAKRRFEWLLDIVRYFRGFVRLPRVNFPCFTYDFDCITREVVEGAARLTREHWELGCGPISNVTWVLENHGAIVVRQAIGGKTLDAFSCWSDGGTPTPYFVLGAEKMCAVRSRFDAAHELGHMVLHRNVDESRLRNSAFFKEAERQANDFAGAFLLPEDGFTQEVDFAPNLEMLVALKSKWRVSIAAMVIRLRHLGLISAEREERLFINIGRRGWRTDEPLDDELEIEEPRLLRRVLEMLISKNMINEQSLTIDLGLRIDDIEKTIGLRGYLGNREGTIIKFPGISGGAN